MRMGRTTNEQWKGPDNAKSFSGVRGNPSGDQPMSGGTKTNHAGIKEKMVKTAGEGVSGIQGERLGPPNWCQRQRGGKPPPPTKNGDQGKKNWGGGEGP